ncbi:NAD(P)-dependent oxidoreductase [Paracoccus sp. Z330]|uniref:L-threonate dehydrogenase n=1 Tax=Paracoccus onchidii TaxID=3017813 RepID=A0ABT4ZGH8_9RHOB|nr:L-threonate dehydrogenase [Paracoccus onchidii]MDB6178462.1 NAD(P)-dependent oxidoreductase [Paracoccus onchidii]
MSNPDNEGDGNRPRIGIIGLGSMGMGMARNLLKAGFKVTGFDLSDGACRQLAEDGGLIAASASETAGAADILFVMVVNATQLRAILTDRAVLDKLTKDAVVVGCSTIAPNDARAIGEHVESAGFHYIDAPVSGGKIGAEAGTLTLMASGPDAAFDIAAEALDAISKKVYRLGDRPGQGATYKVVHQLAAGVHLAVAAELMALGEQAGCESAQLFEVVSQSAGNSWMFSDRVPHMLDGDFTPRSMVDIFIKDLGLVLDTGEDNRMPLPLTAAARQMFLSASALGWGQADDSSVIKAYQALAGAKAADNST